MVARTSCRVMLIELCELNHAASILNNDADRMISVMMPYAITVDNKPDGKTGIGHMNAGLMGQLFGGNVAKVMGVVTGQQQNFVNFAL